MVIPDKSLEEGHFATKQIFSKDWLISWSHSRRFQLGLRLAAQFSGGRVLDYGCGDGTFLAMLMEQPTKPAAAFGAEVNSDTVLECNSRLGRDSIRFVLLDELENHEHVGAYDAVICMEVLEHMIDIEPILDRFLKLLAPSGKLLISVPVETGVPLLIKQAARRVAGWRGIGDYPGTSPYTLKEYCAGVFAGSQQSIVRPVHRAENDYAVHDHKGFNWMVLRRALAQRFQIERILGSPVTWLTPHLASQVWLMASQKSQK